MRKLGQMLAGEGNELREQGTDSENSMIFVQLVPQRKLGAERGWRRLWLWLESNLHGILVVAFWKPSASFSETCDRLCSVAPATAPAPAPTPTATNKHAAMALLQAGLHPQTRVHALCSCCFVASGRVSRLERGGTRRASPTAMASLSTLLARLLPTSLPSGV